MQLEDESFLSSNHSNPMRQASREWKTLAREKRCDERQFIYNHVDNRYSVSNINVSH